MRSLCIVSRVRQGEDPMPNEHNSNEKKTEDLCYDTIYHFTLNGTSLNQVFDTLRLGKRLLEENRLTKMGIYVETERHYKTNGGPDKAENFIGHAHVEIEGLHHRKDDYWFIWGRFRNNWASHTFNPLPTEEAWSKAFFEGTIEMEYGGRNGGFGTLVTSRESFYTNPLREYEKKPGVRFGKPI
ncbi:MAG: hypothetical protein JWL82_591 [Parcubacteria group bacterium]|nr:hypothetical protein [Parcubacteria group bacterium]